MITLVEALGYRCLRDVSQPLDAFQVLVGPNASGKTTFLDVVSLLGDVVSQGPEAAVRKRSDNLSDLTWWRAGEPFELAIEAHIPSDRKAPVVEPGLDTVRYEVLRHEWMDVRRVIHMNMKEHPKNGPRTSLGHSIGRWEGETLVIETGNYAAGVLNQYVEQPGQPTKGLLHSAALTSVERLHLDAARQRLVVEVDLTDPEFFKQPFPRSLNEYAPSALKIEPFNCAREGPTGTLNRK